jgi:hypothetical protein
MNNQKIWAIMLLHNIMQRWSKFFATDAAAGLLAYRTLSPGILGFRSR